MSRCFPYPPPGFIKKASDVATLIDSIKLQKENKTRKEKRKEKRKDKGEKKEKKGEKKEKKQSSVCSKQTEVVHEAHKGGQNCPGSESVLSQKRKREDTEQLEGSSVTEEHGQPLNVQNPSYSSDGTQNSNKRRKQASVASDSRGHGNIIRIKLPLQKHKESESTASIEQLNFASGRNVQNQESDVRVSREQPCSTSGRTENEMHQEQICSGSGSMDLFVHPGQGVSIATQGDASLTLLRKNNSLQGFPYTSNGLRCSMSSKSDEFAQGHTQTQASVPVPGSCSTSRDKKMQKKISKYDNLIQSLYHMAVPSELVDDGEDWLFGGKSLDKVAKKRNVEKQLPANSSVTCSGSSLLYPRARYLEEAEIYALPYTVPF